MSKIVLLILTFLYAHLSFGFCPHESQSVVLYKDLFLDVRKTNNLVLPRELKSSEIQQIVDAHIKITNLFHFPEPQIASIVLTTSDEIQTIYPSVHMSYGGYFDGALSNSCGKNVVFIDMTNPNWTQNKIYTITHELFHAYHFQICGVNCNNNFWLEEALADYVASHLVNKLLINSTNNFLIGEKPIPLFSNKNNYGRNPSHYGHGYLFMDFLFKRISEGKTFQNIIRSNVKSLEEFASFFNVPDHSKLGLIHASNLEALYHEFVFALFTIDSKMFSRPDIYFSANSESTGVLPSGFSFASFNARVWWWESDTNKRLKITLSKSLPVFYSVGTAQDSETESVCNSLPKTIILSEINFEKLMRKCKENVKSIRIVIINTTSESVLYSVRE